MQYYGFDWLAMVCNLLGMFLLSSRSRYGFVFCMLGSSSWLVVGVLISNFPLIFGSSIFIVIQIRGLLNWHRRNE